MRFYFIGVALTALNFLLESFVFFYLSQLIALAL
jgi:hypothetical protein